MISNETFQRESFVQTSSTGSTCCSSTHHYCAIGRKTYYRWPSASFATITRKTAVKSPNTLTLKLRNSSNLMPGQEMSGHSKTSQREWPFRRQTPESSLLLIYIRFVS